MSVPILLTGPGLAKAGLTFLHFLQDQLIQILLSCSKTNGQVPVNNQASIFFISHTKLNLLRQNV
jgi:hypothetical protein